MKGTNVDISSAVKTALTWLGARLRTSITVWKPTHGKESPQSVRTHFWIIIALMVVCTFIYYADQTPVASLPFYQSSFLMGVHDFHRTLFLVPVIYSALVFRIKGSLITSLAFLCVVLPRGFIFSPYPAPLLRPILFVIVTAFVSFIVAIELNHIDREREARSELNEAYQKLRKYDHNLKESQEQLIQVEKMNALGELSAAIAHEINNPLTGVIVYTQLLMKQLNSDSFNKEDALNILTKMESALTYSGKLVRSLLDFARQSTPTLKPIALSSVIDQVMALVGHQAQLEKVKIARNEAPGLPPVKADFSQMEQVFINLTVNAIQAMPEGGELTIHTAPVSDGMVAVAIQDTGCGIPPENMKKLFTPFFTTKEAVKGVGLGLAISCGIVERHGGRLEVKSEVGKGSTFTVFLPVYQPESS